MLLLAFDTATPAVSAAVCEPSGDRVAVRAELTAVDARRHGELLAGSIRTVLSQAGAAMADLTHIAVGIGPGPYTGLRVGLATAHALRDALGIGCHGVYTLDALAQATGRTGPFIAASDARRKEVFWARYADAATRTSGVAVSRPHEVDTEGLPVIGQGAALYPEVFGGEACEPLYPQAAALGGIAVRTLASGGQLPQPRPVYLRRPDAQEPGTAKRVRQWRP